MLMRKSSRDGLVTTDLHKRLQATLGETFTVERELGGGGMSRVFVARDETLGRLVVVKVLAPELAQGVSAERFAREIRVAATLQAPHIVPVLAAGTTPADAGDLPYYTMPYVEGESLRARLASGPIPLVEAVSVLRDVATALEHAHGRRVVHRDIKPENILLSGRTAVVTDFGIAKALRLASTGSPERPTDAAGALTQLGASLGTPAYMAPEQALGDPDTDHRADIYAWGVVAYELLAGRHPFDARATTLRLLAAHVSEAPPPLAERAPGVPTTLAALVMRCLEKAPDRRPQSAGELLAALAAAHAFSGERSGVGRSRRVHVLAAASAIVVLVALAAVAARMRRSAESTQPVLAVLPFENLGPPADAYFADGLTEEVRSRLAGIGGLRVIGGTSARQYKGTTKTARQIARELGVTHVLRATVRWERAPNGGGRVRVSPELERAADQSTVWAQPVEGPYDDVFATQARVAEQVAAALDVALGARERRAVAARPTANLAAYDAYLRGRAHEADPDWTASVGRATIAEYQRAVALDPQFAAAHARLAQAYYTERFYSPDTGLVARARASASRAMALDSTDIDARLARAGVVEADGDAAGAYRMLEALARDAPSDAMVYFRMGWAQQLLGHPERAIRSYERAALLEPRWPAASGELAGAYDRLSRYQDAIRTREREAVLASDFAVVRVFQASSHLLWRADTAAARRELERGDQGQLVPALTRWLTGPAGRAIWWRVMPPSVLAAKDTLTLAGFSRGGSDAPELFHLMKAHHFAFTGRTDRARAHADSVIALAEPTRRHSGAGASTEFVLLPHRLTLAEILAEAYAYTGRAADAARAVDQYVQAARRNPRSEPLVTAAYVDARIGRRDLAVARLTEALRLPSGNLISRALLRADPSWAPLRGHPGFERLIAGGAP